MRSPFAAAASLAFASSAAFAAEPMEVKVGELFGRETVTSCISPAERAAVAEKIAAYQRDHPVPPGPTPRSATKYPFYPQAGVFWQDIFPQNFVDMDNTTGILDYDCSDYTYDGHQGIDSVIVTWTQKNIGVPIFAALDGTVTATADGNFDEQTNGSPANLANYVVVDHGGGLLGYYWHMKNGSVAVSSGNVVKAGQQLGLTASSGQSTGPHLHFESRLSGVFFEAFSGTCGPATSNWVSQPAFRRDFYMREFNITSQDLTGWSPPTDTTRTGWFATGSQQVRFWSVGQNFPASSTYRVRFLRPNNSVSLDSGTGSFGNATFYRASYWYFSPTVNFDTPGTWHVEMTINGTIAVTAPIEVVASIGSAFNRPPNAMGGLHFEPAVPGPTDAMRVVVDTSLLLRDPDYDQIRYRYVWKVNNVTVRTVTTPVISDMLPAQALGDLVECTVTPTDGTADGPPVPISTTIGGPAPVEGWGKYR